MGSPACSAAKEGSRATGGRRSVGCSGQAGIRARARLLPVGVAPPDPRSRVHGGDASTASLSRMMCSRISARPSSLRRRTDLVYSCFTLALSQLHRSSSMAMKASSSVLVTPHSSRTASMAGTKRASCQSIGEPTGGPVALGDSAIGVVAANPATACGELRCCYNPEWRGRAGDDRARNVETCDQEGLPCRALFLRGRPSGASRRGEAGARTAHVPGRLTPPPPRPQPAAGSRRRSRPLGCPGGRLGPSQSP